MRGLGPLLHYTPAWARCHALPPGLRAHAVLAALLTATPYSHHYTPASPRECGPDLHHQQLGWPPRQRPHPLPGAVVGPGRLAIGLPWVIIPPRTVFQACNAAVDMIATRIGWVRSLPLPLRLAPPLGLEVFVYHPEMFVNFPLSIFANCQVP
jgi:hypothetical protein